MHSILAGSPELDRASRDAVAAPVDGTLVIRAGRLAASLTVALALGLLAAPASARSARSVSIEYDGPGRSSSTRETRKPDTPATASSSSMLRPVKSEIGEISAKSSLSPSFRNHRNESRWI